MLAAGFYFFSSRGNMTYLFLHCLLHVAQKWQAKGVTVREDVELGVGVVVGHAVPHRCLFHSKH